MTQGSYSLLIGACAAALLAACGGSAGGAGAPPSVFEPQAQAAPAASQAIGTIVATVEGTPAIGSPGRFLVKITARGVDGSIVTGRYSTPIALTDSDASGATHLSRSSVPNSATPVSISYNGLAGSVLGGFDGATITATSGSASGQVAFLSNGSKCVTLRNIGGYYPCDLRSAYSLPSTTAGNGQTVAVIDAFDNPKAESDLKVYRSEFGLPPCTRANGCFKKVNQSGAEGKLPVADTTGWSIEESLDLDMVSAICPNCHIILVEANGDTFGDLGSAVDAAAALGATQISNSYGGIEFVAETAYDRHYHHPRSSIVASSGDADYGARAEYPAASPYVTAVGGTTLSVGANGRGWDETVWNNEDIQGGGSGCSAYEPKPAWQTDPACSTRMVADVSAIADPFTGVAIYDTYVVSYLTFGGWAVEGGTSAAAPIVASVYALGGAAGASLDYGSRSYSHTSALNDITNGNNGGCAAFVHYFCTAGVGYDGPTGNGTPNGVGAFGGPAIGSARSAGNAPAARYVPKAPIGTRTVRVCPEPKPGSYSCHAILVMPSR